MTERELLAGIYSAVRTIRTIIVLLVLIGAAAAFLSVMAASD